MQKDPVKQGLAREDLARFLAACYYQPGPEFGEEDIFGALVRAAACLTPALEQAAGRLRQAFAAESLETLLLDYTRLFLGPLGILAKPYGSVWLEGDKVVMGESTQAVRNLYREAGFDLDGTFRELPDHVAAELEFLYLLIFRENEARRGDDATALQNLKELKRRFLGDHLGCWIGPFTEAVRQGTQTDFYTQLAILTKAFVRAEQADAGR